MLFVLIDFHRSRNIDFENENASFLCHGERGLFRILALRCTSCPYEFIRMISTDVRGIILKLPNTWDYRTRYNLVH